jgi:hypothetical protein
MTEIAKPVGRPKFELTAQRRALVVRLVAAGANEETVAKALECSLRTIRRHFRQELSQGLNEAVARIGFRVIQAAEAGDLRAAELFLRTKGRWNERLAVDFEPDDAELFAAYKAARTAAPEFLAFLRLALEVVDAADAGALAIEFLSMLAPSDRSRAIAHFASLTPKGIENG